MSGRDQPYREVPVADVAGGLNDSENQARLDPSETPACLNVDFDSGSIETSRGSIPFNRQSAPGVGVRTKVDPALSPLGALSRPIGGTGTGKIGVPLRGYVFLPYSPETDVGGDFAAENDFLTAPQTFHNRRGRTFELNVSFLIPPEERLYEAETRGSGAPAVGAEAAGFTGYDFDEGLDECLCILQKGGDKLQAMSWFLGVVNVGKARNLTVSGTSRESNYGLVFGWLDAPQYGETDALGMKYNLTTGQSPVGGAAAQFCTMAYRAVLLDVFVEPGRRYSAAVQLKVDSGSPGSSVANTAWVGDGYFKVYVTEDAASSITHTTVAIDSAGGAMTVAGMEVIRGPSDSLQYLTRYGVRFSGRDPMYAGLGMRFIPWQPCGFIPFGADDTPLKNGGFQMVDRSATTVASLYGGGIHTLTVTHTATDAYVTLNHQGFVNGNTNGGSNPWAYDTGGGVYTRWDGLGAGTLANCNPNALNGYKLVLTNDASVGRRGAILPIRGYTEVGASYRVDIGWPGATNSSWGPFPALVQCFRWHQRELVIGQVRIWNTPRDYDGVGPILDAYRRGFSIRSSIELNDETEPDLASLVAYWPLDDAEGGACEEKVVGGSRTAFLCPFGLGTTKGGGRGKQMLFLSGEGEAPCIDFSDNPVVMRELGNMLSGSTQGFALELTCVFVEAPYGLQEIITVPDSAILGQRARLVPTILSWDTKNASASGNNSQPRPILALTHNGVSTDTNAKQSQRPTGFFVEVAHRSDQQDVDPITPSDLLPFYLSVGPNNVTRYDLTAAWVGKLVTIQIGVQTTGVADQYDVYIAMTPKDAFFPAAGDPSDAEFAYWTAGGGSYVSPHFSAAHITIARKDLVRSVVTLGRWNPLSRGYSECQPRMLVSELRVFACPASGALPATNGGILTARNGKLEGGECLPARELSLEDLLLPLGAGLSQANVVDGSTSATAPTSAHFYNGSARSTLKALTETYLYVPGDPHFVLSDEGGPQFAQEELYRVESVAASGQTAVLAEPYGNATRTNAKAYSVRTFGVTAFGDDIRDKLLTLGAGTAFDPGVTTTADVVLTEELWANTAPVTSGVRLRIFSPLGRTSLAAILPSWTRGVTVQRRNPILGLEGFNERKIAVARGSIFEVDDRWRHDGPTPDLDWSLAFRGKKLRGDTRQGIESDRVVFGSTSQAAWVPSSTNAYVAVFDAWVKLDSIEQYQTVMWLGNPTTDPMQNASASAGGHQFQFALRFNHGRPQFIFGSTAAFTGVSVPEKGLYVATGASPISEDRWTQVRFYIQTYTNGAAQQIVRIPALKVNGRTMAVTVNATDVGITAPAATDWLRASTVVSGSGCKLVLGATRDAYRQPDAAITFNGDNPQGDCVPPQRLQGWMHSLDGLLSETAISFQPLVYSGTPPDFDPFEIDYAQDGVSLQFHALVEPLGVGHKVEDEPGSQYGVIVSHPFISLWHELGSKDLLASFAEYGSQMYVTNGSRPARVGPNTSGLAGVLPPNDKPSVRIERLPLWKPNYHAAVGVNDPNNDPCAQAAAGAALQINHYDNHGNNYWIQLIANTPGASEIAWIKDAAGFPRYWAFKARFRARDVSGRRQLFGRRNHQRQGGPWGEMVDGKIRVGWYDTYLKKDVYVETSQSVVEPGIVHYIYFRKRWPQNDSVEGNWMNSHPSNGDIRAVAFTSGIAGTFQVGEQVAWTAGGGAAGTGIVIRSYGLAGARLEFVLTTGGNPGATSAYTGATSTATGTSSVAANRPMHDSLVVRRERNDALVGTTLTPTQMAVNPTRNCVGFTTNSLPAPVGTTATGMTSLPGIRYEVGGVNTDRVRVPLAGIYLGVEPFHTNHVGGYFQFGTVGGGAAAFVGKLYQIIQRNSATEITLRDAIDGSTPNFAGVTATEGACFIGTSLVKSDGFDSSKAPDAGAYDIQFFGSSEAADENSGLLPFDGEWWTPGWTSALSTVAEQGTDGRVFENVDTSTAGGAAADPIEVGTDTTLDIRTAVPGELCFDTWVAANQVGTFCSVDGRTYAAAGGGDSTQPNVTLFAPSGLREPVVAHDTANPINSANAVDIVWRYLQGLDVLEGKRFLRTRFYDPDQNESSDPSPPLLVSPAGEDDTNPSGLVRLVATNLPASRQGAMVDTLVYASLKDGDAATMFLVRRVPSGTREVSFELLDSKIAAGAPLDFINGMPPRCEILTEAQSRIFYCAVEFQPDGLYFSGAGTPVSIDYRQNRGVITRLNSGLGSKITMAKGLDGYVVIAKRRALSTVQVNTDETASLRVVSMGVGCVSQDSAVSSDDRLYWVGEKGLYVASRSGVTDFTRPVFVATKVRHLFLEELDPQQTARLTACLNRRRSQYVVAGYADEAKRPDLRITAEFDYGRADAELSAQSASSHRYSRYRGPNITALASVQALDGGLESVIAGTDDGFVVWMDRSDTDRHMLGESGGVWGFKTVPAAAGSTTAGMFVPTGGTTDTTLEGMRGAVARYTDINGEVIEVPILGCVSTAILFDQLADGAVPLDVQVELGSQERAWETGWAHMGNPQTRKRGAWIDFVNRREATGKMRVRVYTDFDEDQAVVDGTWDLTAKPEHEPFDIGASTGRYFKFKLSEVPGDGGVSFQVSGFVVRVRDESQV